jgi:DNA repair protein RecO (recombination protein O)
MIFTTPGVILRHAAYRDYDMMATLLTPERGKLDFIARGARSAKSTKSSAVEIFTLGEFTLDERKARLSLDQAHITEGYYPIREDYQQLEHGAYWLKLLDQATHPGQAARAQFDLTIHALAYLAYSDIDPALLTLAFELQLLNIEGFAPRAEACVVCGRPLNAEAAFDAELGGAACVLCAPNAHEISYGARRILYRLPKTPYESVKKLIDHPDWHEAARHVRNCINERIPLQDRFIPQLV